MRKILKDKGIEWLFFAILAFQLGVWVWLNLFHVQHAMDDDLAKLMTHTVEMWKNRTLYIKDWAYFTMGEADCAALFGMFFYTFTRNINLSFGLANLVNIAVFIWVVWTLFADLKIAKVYCYLALLVIFVPYMYGQLYYGNMLFYAGAQYIYKVLLPIMLLTILYHPKELRKRPSFAGMTALFLFLLLINALQSGIYVLVVGFLPVFAFEITRWLGKAKEERRYDAFCLAVSVGSVLIFLAGTWISVKNGLDAKGNTMNLLQSGRIVDGLHNVLYQFLLILNVLPDRATSAVSAAGLSYVWKILLLAGILYFGFTGNGSFLNLRELFLGKEIQNSRLREVKTVLFSLFIWNTVILVLTQCTVRYLLVGFIPLMLSAVMGVAQRLSDNRHIFFKNLFLPAIGMMTAWVSMYAVIYAQHYYFIYNEDVPRLSSYFKEQQYENVFFCDDSGTVEKLRQLDDGIVYVVYYPDERQTFVIDYYLAAAERSSYADRNALVVPDDVDASRIPEYISSIYTEKTRIGKFVIYESSQNRFDGQTGLEFGSYAIDYPYVNGYEYQGEVNRDGLLLTYGVEGYALESPVYLNEKEKDYTVEMQYFTGVYTGVVGAAELWCGDTMLESKELTTDANTVEFTVNGLRNCQIRVRVDSDKSIAVGQIVFQEIE